MRHDEPDEADQPADRDGRRGHERGQAEEDRPLAPDVDAEVRRRLLAEEQPVERSAPGAGSAPLPTRMSGAAAASRCHEAPSKPPSR